MQRVVFGMICSLSVGIVLEAVHLPSASLRAVVLRDWLYDRSYCFTV